MEHTAGTTPIGSQGRASGDVVRASPFEFAQTAIGGQAVVRVGSVVKLGKCVVVRRLQEDADSEE